MAERFLLPYLPYTLLTAAIFDLAIGVAKPELEEKAATLVWETLAMG